MANARSQVVIPGFRAPMEVSAAAQSGGSICPWTVADVRPRSSNVSNFPKDHKETEVVSPAGQTVCESFLKKVDPVMVSDRGAD